MILLDVSIVNVALPSIEHGLAVAPQTAQWVVSGYTLSLGLTLVSAGRLGDSLGRRRMFLVALTAFVVTSALTGAAPTAGPLIAARLLQGVAGGMLIPQNSGLIQELFQGAERGRAFGVLGATIGTPGDGCSTSMCRSAWSRSCWPPVSYPLRPVAVCAIPTWT
ncbi:MFS transporter [Rhodococcus sp. NPDC059968]|uniref:MFS transporter n=1 Tax=Rhodococcus sp. NPDC059968 TaxID=3347017 RepID=UPI00367152A5